MKPTYLKITAWVRIKSENPIDLNGVKTHLKSHFDKSDLSLPVEISENMSGGLLNVEEINEVP